MNAQLIQGDALTELQNLESETIDCCITSPPYWALRDYKTDGQLGLEPTFQEYITKLVGIFDEVKRVLKKSGTCWIVLGDTYAGTGKDTNRDPKYVNGRNTKSAPINNKVAGIPQKSLCMIPERFSIAMIDHGWILRNKIIWYKPNCMPSSAKDRFTVDWEYVYFFTKSQKYFFETQYEPIQETTVERNRYKCFTSSKHKDLIETGNRNAGETDRYIENPLGRIKRCVWKISTKPFSGAHFAVFPPDLVQPMIKAGCPEYICNKCQTHQNLKYHETKIATRNTKAHKITSKVADIRDPNRNFHDSEWSLKRLIPIRNIDGTTNCGCNSGFHPGTVLDPFVGAGTTGLVALQHARNFIGIELNPEYITLARKRLNPWLEQQRLEILAQ